MIELNDGDVICPKCKGSGKPEFNGIKKGELFLTKPFPECEHCNGEGKLDWVEAVVGKQKFISVWDSLSAYTTWNDDSKKTLKNLIIKNIGLKRNMRQRKKKPLKEGMVYCKKCNGNGLIKPYRLEPYLRVTNKCDKCNGIGQILWIDLITGKEPYLNINYDMKHLKKNGYPAAGMTRNRRFYSKGVLNELYGKFTKGLPIGTMTMILAGSGTGKSIFSPWYPSAGFVRVVK